MSTSQNNSPHDGSGPRSSLWMARVRHPIWLMLACMLLLSGCAVVPFAQAAGGILLTLAALIGIASCGGSEDPAGGTTDKTIVWPDVISIDLLDSSTGFILEGTNPGDQLGFSVAAGVDVNGDGLGDMVVGAPGATGNEYHYNTPFSFGYFQYFSGAGVAHVLFGDSEIGTTLNSSGPTVLDARYGTHGIAFNGRTLNAKAGTSVALAKDVDGDGVGDILIGEPDAQNSVGRGWVVFGDPGQSGLRSLQIDPGGGISGEIAGDGSEGFYTTNDLYYYGSGGTLSYNRIGMTATALDINGDSFSDAAFGAPATAVAYSGYNDYFALPRTITVFGQQDMAPASSKIDAPSSFSPTTGTMFGGGGYYGLPGGWSHDSSIGQSVVAGDINDDGVEDLILGLRKGTKGEGSFAGGAIVVFGQSGASPTFPTGIYDVNFMRVSGSNYSVYDDLRVGFLGDVNGDGFGDFALTQPTQNRAWVVFGRDGTSGDLQFYSASGANFVGDGTEGFRIDFSTYYSGCYGVESLEEDPGLIFGADVNNDGINDLIIGIQSPPGRPNNTENLVHVVFGKSSLGAGGTLDLTNGPVAGEGFTVKSLPLGSYERFDGVSVARGDVNGDGYKDVAIGVSNDRYAGDKGRVYVIFSPKPAN